MAKLVFTETVSAQLQALPIQDGRLTFTKDTRCLYRDTASERVLVSGNPITFIVSENTLAISCTNKYVKAEVIDDDTGLSFTISG